MTIKEIVDLLRRTKRVHFLTKPATLADIVQCEVELGVPLPQCLREMLTFSNGMELYESDEILGTDRFWEYAQTLSEVTRELRHAPTHPLRVQAIPFCIRDVGNSYYCLDLESMRIDGTLPVFIWSRDKGESEVRYASFEDWFEEVVYRQSHGRYFPEIGV